MRVGLLLKVLASLLAVPLGLASALPASAQAGLAGDALRVCVLRDAPGLTPGTLFATPDVFDCRTEQVGLGAGDYWVMSNPVRLSGARDARIGSLWQRRLTLYARYADGAVVRCQLDPVAMTRHVQLGAIVVQPLPARAAPLVRLLWHVEGSTNMRGILTSPRIATSEQSARSNLLMSALYAAFAGLCLSLLISNLALWGALRHRFQLAYCAMVLALLLYTFSSSGAFAWVFPNLPNTVRLRVNYLALGLSGAAALAFARTFFEPQVFTPGLARLVAMACGGILVTACAFALFAPWQVAWLDKLYSIAFVGVMVAVVGILWRAWRTRSDYLWLFAVAWGAPAVMATVRVATSFRLLGYNFWVDNSTLPTMTVEAVLSSLAIAYRMRLLSLDRDDARASEIAARLLADTDSLTGLLNRRAFLAQAIGREGEQTLLIADLDHFKQVNDTIGHDGGDEVLRVFARTLRQSLPVEALVARIGGEEFAILTPAGEAVPGDEILARLRSGRMPYDLAVTASIGTCTGPMLRETDWKALYACADRALFEAKSAGRDRVRGRTLPDRLAA